MKILLSILLVSFVELCFSSKLSLGGLTPSFTPVHYAMIKDFHPGYDYNNMDDLEDTGMIFALYINREISNFLATSKTGSKDDNDSFNLDIIQNVLNKNFSFMKEMKSSIEKDLPEMKDVLMVSRRGFKCDENFCNKFGDGHHAIGICTPYSCVCSAFAAEGMKCEDDLYYNPVFEYCDVPSHIKICGL